MNTIQIAAKLYQCRDNAKFLFGDRYPDGLKNYMEAVSIIADKQHESNVIAAATAMASRSRDGMQQMLLLAAAVELTEPSSGQERL